MSPQDIPRKMMIRGYGRRNSRGTWIVVCIDLDLVVERASFEEAMVAMREQIISYVKAVLDTSDKKSITHLLFRPAPMGDRLKYHFFRMVCSFHQLKKSLFCFSEPLEPLSLAA